jgi:8-oxo-dGTP diphosphatase
MSPDGAAGAVVVVVVVDVANVIGSRPTGWWRDRAGAARGFVEHVRATVRLGRLAPPVVLVLEGQARRGAAESAADGVEVVHAAGSGDDTIVAVARARSDVVAVTADRALVERLRAVGADVRGPGWFLDRLDRLGR